MVATQGDREMRDDLEGKRRRLADKPIQPGEAKECRKQVEWHRANAGIARRLETKLTSLGGWSGLDFHRLATRFEVRSDRWLFELAMAIVQRLPRFVSRSDAAGTTNVLADERDRSIARFVDLYLTESKLCDSKIEAPKRSMAWAVKAACEAFEVRARPRTRLFATRTSGSAG
jgi:hypothetical protein